MIFTGPHADVKAENWKFWQDIQKGDEYSTKHASNFVKNIILTELREDGATRRGLTYQMAGPADLQFDPQNKDIPTIFIPIEKSIGGYMATSTDWSQPTTDFYYTGDFIRCHFFPMVSKEVVIKENQILSTIFPIRQYVEGIIRNDFLAVEDFQYIEQLERCLAQQALYGSANIFNSVNTRLTISDIVDLGTLFSDSKSAMSTLYIHESTYRDIMKFTQNDVGSRVMERIFDTGLMGENLKMVSILGQRWIITNNQDIVPKKTIYAVAPQNMHGVFMEFQQPQVYIKWERGTMRMYARQVLGRAIGNIFSMAKLKLA